MLNLFGIIIDLVQLLSSGFFEANPRVQESNKIDDNEKDERVVLQAVINDWPEGVFNKVNKPVGSVAESRTSSKPSQWKQLGGNHPRDDTASAGVCEQIEDGCK